MIDQLDLHVRRGAEIGYRGGGQPADPEEGVDLAVLECVDGFGDPEPLALHVLVLVEPGGLDDAERHHLGRAAGRAGGHALALEVGQFLDPGAFDAHHVHAVRVEHHERADLTGLPLNLSSPLSASSAASTITSATSLCCEPINLRLSTEPPVTRAVACTPGTYLDSTFAMPPPSG